MKDPAAVSLHWAGGLLLGPAATCSSCVCVFAGDAHWHVMVRPLNRFHACAAWLVLNPLVQLARPQNTLKHYQEQSADSMSDVCDVLARHAARQCWLLQRALQSLEDNTRGRPQFARIE